MFTNYLQQITNHFSRTLPSPSHWQFGMAPAARRPCTMTTATIILMTYTPSPPCRPKTPALKTGFSATPRRTANWAATRQTAVSGGGVGEGASRTQLLGLVMEMSDVQSAWNLCCRNPTHIWSFKKNYKVGKKQKNLRVDLSLFLW